MRSSYCEKFIGYTRKYSKLPTDDKGNVLIDAKVFHLPSQSSCLRSLRNWEKKAGINKYIT